MSTDIHRVEHISIDRIKPMHAQPRTVFNQESLEGLAQSIQTHGIIQPIIVTKSDQDTFSIIAGERRWRAAKIAGLTSIPCINREIAEHDRLEVAIIENIQREDISVLDEAMGYRRLIEDHGYTHEVIGKKIGKSRSVVTNALRILDLPQPIIEDLRANKLSSAHARTLCSIEDEAVLKELHESVLTQKLSVRETEDRVRSALKRSKPHKKVAKKLGPDLQHIAELLQDHFGTRVKIIGTAKAGKIQISYYSSIDLERILDLTLKNNLDKS